jgi:predicted N-formylglutamate amidohydrolase
MPASSRHLLLQPSDPPPVVATHEGARSDVLLLGDHAGNAIPASLGDLGLSSDDRRRHIAWDLGINELGHALAVALDATFIWQPFSRLVIDCNRDPHAEAATPDVSDHTCIPGNTCLDEAARDQRREAIHAPYQRRIAQEIAARLARGVPPVVVSLHSFTPSLRGSPRPWHVGILHDRGNTSLSFAMLRRLERESALVVGDNEPYRMDGVDHTVPRHAYPGDLPYLEIEFRQDFLADTDGVHVWAERFAGWLRDAREA